MDFSKNVTDTKGRAWNMEIGWGTFRRVKEKTGIDLDTFVPRKGMTKEDHTKAVERFLDLIYSSTDFPPVLMTILDSQMKAAGVSEDDFMNSFESPQSITAITDAFRQALVDFIPDPLRKALFLKTQQGVARMQAMAMNRLDANTEAIIQAAERKLDKEIESTLKSLSTDSPESSESTPKSPSPKA